MMTVKGTKRERISLSATSPPVDVDQNHAQVLIELSSAGDTVEKARTVIEGIGVRVIEARILSSQWVLLKLDVKDMRDVVLKLTQNGFLKIEGYNACSHSMSELDPHRPTR